MNTNNNNQKKRVTSAENINTDNNNQTKRVTLAENINTDNNNQRKESPQLKHKIQITITKEKSHLSWKHKYK